eukprot:2637434-Rhodomonas_salina.1
MAWGACTNPGLCKSISGVRFSNHKRKKEDSKQKGSGGKGGKSAHLSVTRKGLLHWECAQILASAKAFL